MKCRTSNPSEKAVIDRLEKEGYEVLKRGWPDLVAFKDGDVRFIEVKRLTTFSGKLSTSKLKPAQKLMAELFARKGIQIEIIRGL